MKKTTHRILSHIPFVNVIMSIAGYDKFLICSPMIAEGHAEPILRYARQHPDVAITRKLGNKILRESAGRRR